MTKGDILLIPFPFAETSNIKVRPAVLITQTSDKYRDIIISAISSILPNELSENEIFLRKSNLNNLRTDSILKVDRLATIKKESIITILGKLTYSELDEFKIKFKKLID